MMKISKKLTLKDLCKHLVCLYSSAQSIAIKEKLPLSVISYPHPQLVTLLIKNNKYNQLKNFVLKVLKKKSYPLSVISYPLSVISYPYPYLVTFYPQLVTFLPAFSYPLSVISYPNRLKCVATKPKKNFP